MPDTAGEGGKGKIIILAALVIISALGVSTYYDEQGSIIESNKTHDVVIGDDTKIVDERVNENTTTKVVWTGTTTIKDAMAAKTKADAVVLKEATVTALKDVKYPYNVSVPASKTEIKILKYKCNAEICGYWIQAFRDGKEVYTNSPIWISPPPYQVVVSETYDSKLDETTVTLKEDPKAAVESVLRQYVDRQPIGKAVSYER